MDRYDFDWLTDSQKDYEAMVKEKTKDVTFKPTPPYSSGWKGWTHHVDLLIDGEPAGELIGSGSNRSKMEYGYSGSHPLLKRYPKFVLPVGLNDAKEAVRRAIVRML